MAEKRLSHAYMIVGTDDTARRETGTNLAAALLCREENAPCGSCRDCKKVFSGIHPDVTVVERTPAEKGQLHREILVEQVRAVTADAVVAPNEAEWKVYLIPEADRLNIPAQNALLKALEDPPGHACFILCAAASDALLPTVRSRCVRVDSGHTPGAVSELSELARSYITLAAQGDEAAMTMFCMLRVKLTREETEALLEEIYGALCDILCARRENPGLAHKQIFKLTALLEQARDYLRRNVAPKQVFGLLAAETLR